MKTHDEFRELAALCAYGELEAGDLERLERHLSECAECSALARELEVGLGRLAAAPSQSDLPAGWRTALDAAIVAEPPLAGLRSQLWIAAASFLAGAALTWSVSAGSGWGEERAREAQRAAESAGLPAVGSSSSFERSTPPPRARDGASLPPLAELYLRR